MSKKYTTDNITISEALNDGSGVGTSGQVLSSTGSGVSWINGSAIAGGPYLALTGGTLTGAILFNNNVSETWKDTAGTTTRMMVLNSGNVAYIGPIDTYSGGPILYGVSANVTSQNFYTGATLALTLDTSQNATFAGTINSGAITSTGTVGASNVFATAKMAVASSGVHGSYDFYNNGTSYFNGDVTVDANLTISGGGKATSAATVAGDGVSTLTTKSYVDGLVTGVPVYIGTWNASTNSPDLTLAANKVLGNYYIVDTTGTSAPNGVGTEPDSWNVGDWAIFSDITSGAGTDLWQKIDNTSVISGSGTGEKMVKWAGASGANSETLADSLVSESGTEISVAGTFEVDSDNFPTGSGLAMGDYQSGGYKWIQSFGSQPLSINPLGNNVGIGTDSPAGLLHIKATGSGTSTTIITEDSARKIFIGRDSIKATDLSNNPAQLYIQQNGGNVTLGGTLTVSGTGDSSFAGNLGVGVASPDGNLEVITSTVVSGASDTVNNVLIGLQSANRPTIILDTADTTHTNRSWNITNVGSAGSLFIGRNGLDVMVMDNSGNVGVGTDSPGARLDVVASNVSVTPNSESSAVFRRNGNNYISILSNSSNEGGILFGNSTDNNDASISYGHNTQAMSFSTADSERMRITSAGDVGIGTSNPYAKLNVSGNIRAENGSFLAGRESAANPAFAFHDDGDTGMFNIASNILAFATGGAERVRIDSSGRVGIGMTPAEMLDIKAASGDTRIRLDAVSGSDTEIKFYNAGAVQYTIGHDDGTDNFVVGGANVDTPLVSVTKAGNVGIGTDSPGAKLHTKVGTSGGSPYDNTVGVFAEGASRSIIQLSSTSDAYVMFGDAAVNNQAWLGYNHTTNQLSLHTGSTITMDGNVGIGTTAPTGFRLVVENTSEDLLKLHNSTDGLDSLISFTNPGGTLGRIQGIDNGGLAFDTGNNAGGINSSAMFIDNAGNIGVGTVSPTAKLDIEGTSALLMTRTSSGLATYIENDGGYAAQYMYQIGGNAKIALHTNGSSYFNGGNVGVGTVSPGGLLDVSTASVGGNVSAFFRNTDNTNAASGQRIISQVGGASSGDPRLVLSITGVAEYNLGIDNSDSDKFKIGNGSDPSAGTNFLTIDTTGNIGVGTANPETARLNVRGSTSDSTSQIIQAANLAGATRFVVRADGQSIFYGSDNSESVRITETGNIGINTTAPLARLDVRGSIRSDQVGSGPDGTTDTTQIDQLIGDAGPDNMALGTPNQWLRINISGTDYVIPAYTAP